MDDAHQFHAVAEREIEEQNVLESLQSFTSDLLPVEVSQFRSAATGEAFNRSVSSLSRSCESSVSIAPSVSSVA